VPMYSIVLTRRYQVNNGTRTGNLMLEYMPSFLVYMESITGGL